MKKPSNDKLLAADGSGLTAEDERLLRQLASEYAIQDPAVKLILKTTRGAYDRLVACQSAIDREGVSVVDRWGQTKSHPLLAAERDARAAVLAGLRALHLDVEPVNDGPGRPGGR